MTDLDMPILNIQGNQVALGPLIDEDAELSELASLRPAGRQVLSDASSSAPAIPGL